ncbi:uncharacterized protein LOC106770173 [Vigna radiata var. radiata]|uniref:Uncharacterized protein LOC106770173 n=1 Tax=Vigna radiata var. radiata TaxID=3916 RepID=A0A1S3UZG5_VIGRR|nr:uncharacterized protein LOC106770173 [Vigna radiata var. radiata]
MRVVFRVQKVSNVIEGESMIDSSAKEAWNILVRCHSGGEKVKKVRLQTLRKQYEHLEMEDSDKILRSMPAAFDHIVVTIEETRYMEKLKIEELQSAFEAYEMRQNGRKKHDDQALRTQHVSGEGKKKSNKWKSKDFGQKKKWKKETYEQEEKSDTSNKKGVTKKQYTKKEKKNMECFVCHKKGHLSYECWFNKDA